jgi:hypothetical protein
MSVEQVNVPGNGGDVNIFLRRVEEKRIEGIPKNNSAGTSRIECRAAYRATSFEDNDLRKLHS